MITITTTNLEEWQAHFDLNNLSDLERLIILFRLQIFIRQNVSNQDVLNGDRVVGQDIEFLRDSLDFRVVIKDGISEDLVFILQDVINSFQEAFNTTKFTFTISKIKDKGCGFYTINLDYSNCDHEELTLLLK